MNRIVIAAAFVMLVSGTAFGQTQGEKPAAAPAGGMKEEMKPAPQKDITIVQGPGQSAVKEDARHCLEHSTNVDIIKCAEPYLPLKMKKM
ncbi:MAG TPA: hypothetical protein VLC73_19015 [Burkholderiales bacterium]|nr:hypothetical protein [Burkholderiales bacterium]